MMPAIICLMGPTASGKTDLAVALVQQLPCEIISVDSAMVYRGMDIGSAKPTAEILAKAPHRLLDIRDVTQTYSVADFCVEAKQHIDEILAAGKIPLLVGGTMLYFHGLLHGLAPLPSASATLRAELEVEANAQGWPAMHAKLKCIDPVAAAGIHSNDPQRIGRALEVYALTGTPISEFWRQAGEVCLPYPSLNLVLLPQDRLILHTRIAARLQAMLAQGLVQEVANFYARPELHPPPAAMRAVGYRQVWRYLAGEIDALHMEHDAIVATRRFAKRQLTWLRHWQDCQLLTSDAPGLLTQAITKIENFLQTLA